LCKNTNFQEFHFVVNLLLLHSVWFYSDVTSTQFLKLFLSVIRKVKGVSLRTSRTPTIFPWKRGLRTSEGLDFR
jgi:hypothetical protein